MALVKQLPPDRLGNPRCRVDWYPKGREDGERIRRVLPGTRDEILKMIRERERDRQSRRWGLPRRRTYEQVAREFLEAWAGHRASYQEELARVLGGVLVQRWGWRDIDTIGSRDVQEYLADRRKQVKAGTLRKEHTMLSTLFRWAERQEPPLVARNPCLAVPKPRRTPRPPRWLTTEEYAKMYDKAPGYLRPILDVLVVLGLRASELCRLTWGDVRGPVLFLVERKAGDWSSLPVPEGLLVPPQSAPDARQRIFSRPVIYHGRVKQSDAWTKDALRRAILTASKDAGLTGVTGPHVLRHTCASWLCAAGVGLRRVQRILGHATITTTEQYEHSTYMNWPEEAQKLPPQTLPKFARIAGLLGAVTGGAGLSRLVQNRPIFRGETTSKNASP